MSTSLLFFWQELSLRVNAEDVFRARVAMVVCLRLVLMFAELTGAHYLTLLSATAFTWMEFPFMRIRLNVQPLYRSCLAGACWCKSAL